MLGELVRQELSRLHTTFVPSCFTPSLVSVVQVLLVLLSTSFVRVCLQRHRAVGFPNHGVARIARYSHRAVVCCSQSPQQDYQNTLGGIQGRHHWQRPGKMNSERLAWLNWAALATTEPNLLWAGYFLYGFLQRDLFRSRGIFCLYGFLQRDLFRSRFRSRGIFFLYGFLQRDLFRSRGIFFPIPRDLFFVWFFTAGSFPIPF